MTRADRRRQMRGRQALLERLARLDAIYAALPSVKCQGLCHDTCGPILAPAIEWARVSLGEPLHLRGINCPLLTPEKRCGNYAARPLICRLFGVVDDELLRCHHGCVPERYLSNDDVDRLFRRVCEVQGDGKIDGPLGAREILAT